MKILWYLTYFLQKILFYHVFFSLFLNYFVIPAVIAQICNPVAELVITIGIPTNEAKAETETHIVIIAGTKISDRSM